MPNVELFLARMQIPFGHHPKRTNRRERPRFRSVERVVALAVANQLALEAVRQVQVSHENVPRVEASTVFVVTTSQPSALSAIVKRRG